MGSARIGSAGEAATCPVSGVGETDDTLPLVSFHGGDRPTVKIVPASRWRDWMNATDQRLANRCLPLLIANQAGWVLLNPAPFKATWDGGDRKGSLEIEYASDVPEEARVARSHFGYGIVTFNFADVISTPPGWNLFARGPTNSPKDGICALDGLIETDWSATPFTMNWKLTRPGSVQFAQDEPFCHITPQRRGELERFRPEYRSLRSRPELAKRIWAWSACRLMVQLGKGSTRRAGDDSFRRLWLEDYFRGRSPTGETSPEHQTTLRLAPFAGAPESDA
jgi:Family of unknown function (DUF6065)